MDYNDGRKTYRIRRLYGKSADQRRRAARRGFIARSRRLRGEERT